MTSDRRRGTVGLIARREITTRLRAKSFYVVTALLVAGVIAIGIAARVTGGDSAETWDIGLVDDPGAADVGDAIGDVASAVEVEVTVETFDDLARARATLEDGDLDAVVDVDGRALLFEDDVNDRLNGVVQQAWVSTETSRSLIDAGLGADEVDDALAVEPLDVTSTDGDGNSDIGVLAGMLAAVLLFISLQTFGTYVLTGVVEEKASAVVEVLLVRTRPQQLLAGKVIGIGTVALGQFLATIAAALVALAISGTSVPSSVWSAVPTTALWFLGGYTMYSTLYALAGSLVSRQEDAQAAAAPIGVLLVGAYMMIYVLGFEPESTASAVLSMVPFVAPMLMPVRMASGAASMIEIVIAFALLAATTWLIWRVASRIYEQVLLRRGSRISWTEALAVLRP